MSKVQDDAKTATITLPPPALFDPTVKTMEASGSVVTSQTWSVGGHMQTLQMQIALPCLGVTSGEHSKEQDQLLL